MPLVPFLEISSQRERDVSLYVLFPVFRVSGRVLFFSLSALFCLSRRFHRDCTQCLLSLQLFLSCTSVLLCVLRDRFDTMLLLPLVSSRCVLDPSSALAATRCCPQFVSETSLCLLLPVCGRHFALSQLCMLFP